MLDEVGAAAPARLATFDETGELDTAYQQPGLPRFRVNAFRQRGDISFAFRVIPTRGADLRRACAFRQASRNLAEEHRGLILVTGATGVGKTTTLASMLGHINRTRRQHIVTIEDPIEILHSDESCIVNQREVGLDTDSFNEALRRVLRQDPDVILIGELRDAETAETALQAAESGHLVLSTMHTLDAAETVAGMVEFFPAMKQAQVRSILAGVLRGVISQRLAAAHRRRPRRGSRGDGREQAHRRPHPREQGRSSITEAIAEGEFFHMQTLTAALIELVLSGDVDREIAAAAAPNHHDFVIALERALKEQAARGSRRRPEDVRLRRTRRRPCASRDAPPPVRRGGRASTRRRARLLAQRDARRAGDPRHRCSAR